MSKTHVGTIKISEINKRFRLKFPRQTEKAYSSPKGKRGYNRKESKRAIARDQE